MGCLFSEDADVKAAREEAALVAGSELIHLKVTSYSVATAVSTQTLLFSHSAMLLLHVIMKRLSGKYRRHRGAEF